MILDGLLLAVIALVLAFYATYRFGEAAGSTHFLEYGNNVPDWEPYIDPDVVEPELQDAMDPADVPIALIDHGEIEEALRLAALTPRYRARARNLDKLVKELKAPKPKRIIRRK